MPLKYDFDMFSAIDESIIDDPKYNDLFARAGIRSDMAANKVALFRDQRTVDALRAAPEPLKRYLLDCGFGLNRFDSGAPDGYYPAKDEAARLRVLDALGKKLKDYNLPKSGEAPAGGFVLADFIAYLAAAQPIGGEAAPAKGGSRPVQRSGPSLGRLFTNPFVLMLLAALALVAIRHV